MEVMSWAEYRGPRHGPVTIDTVKVMLLIWTPRGLCGKDRNTERAETWQEIQFRAACDYSRLLQQRGGGGGGGGAGGGAGGEAGGGEVLGWGRCLISFFKGIFSFFLSRE